MASSRPVVRLVVSGVTCPQPRPAPFMPTPNSRLLLWAEACRCGLVVGGAIVVGFDMSHVHKARWASTRCGAYKHVCGVVYIFVHDPNRPIRTRYRDRPTQSIIRLH